MALLESVPNVSEGRNASAVAAIAEAFSGAGARMLDTHVDGDHNRAVITLVGEDHGVEEGLVAGIYEASRHIDLRMHDGVHPRVGAADVVPVVPLAAADLGRAVDVALVVGARVGDELGLPVFLYGEIGDGRRPAFFRRGGPDELQRRIELEAISIASACVSLGYLSAGFLQLAKVIDVAASDAMIWVFPLTALIFGLAKAVLGRRYR